MGQQLANPEYRKTVMTQIIDVSAPGAMEAYFESCRLQSLAEWDQMYAGVIKQYNPDNAMHMLPVLQSFTYGPKGKQLRFDFLKGVKGKDAAVLIWNKQKYVALNFNYHAKADLNWNDEPQGCTNIEKTLTSLLLMAGDGTIGALSVWNEVVKECAADNNMRAVVRVID